MNKDQIEINAMLSGRFAHQRGVAPDDSTTPNMAELALSDITGHIYHMVEKEFPGWSVEYDSRQVNKASIQLYAEDRPYLSVRVEHMEEDNSRRYPIDIDQTAHVKELANELFEKEPANSPEHFMYLRLGLIVNTWLVGHRTHVTNYTEGVTASGTAYHVEYQGPTERIFVSWWVYNKKIETARMFCDAVKSISECMDFETMIDFPNECHLVLSARNEKMPRQSGPLFEVIVRGKQAGFDPEILQTRMDTQRYIKTHRDYINAANKRFGGYPGVKMLGRSVWVELKKMGYYPVMVNLHRDPKSAQVNSVFCSDTGRVIITVDHLYVV